MEAPAEPAAPGRLALGDHRGAVRARPRARGRARRGWSNRSRRSSGSRARASASRARARAPPGRADRARRAAGSRRRARRRCGSRARAASRRPSRSARARPRGCWDSASPEQGRSPARRSASSTRAGPALTPRHLQRALRQRSSSATSAAGAEWVSAPIEIRCTPVSATARTLARWTPPLASSSARAAQARRDRAAASTAAVVEQQEVGARLDGGQRVGLRLHLDLHAQPGRRRGARGLHRRLDAAREGHVVVLEQDPVVEAGAVVARAADRGRVLVERAPARQRLARVDDLGARAGDRLDIAARERSRRRTGASGSSARCARPRAARAAGRARGRARQPAASASPSAAAGSNASARLERREDGARDLEAADDEILAGLDHRLGRRHRAGSRARDVTSPEPMSSSSARSTSARQVRGGGSSTGPSMGRRG